MKNLFSSVQFGWPAKLVALAIILTATSAFASPTITVSASPTKITSDGQDATFTLTVSPTSSRKIGLTFVMSGTAIQGRDYVLVAAGNKMDQIIIPVGTSSLDVTLHSLSDDSIPNVKKNAVFNILAGSRYRVGSPNQAQIIIQGATD